MSSFSLRGSQLSPLSSQFKPTRLSSTSNLQFQLRSIRSTTSNSSIHLRQLPSTSFSPVSTPILIPRNLSRVSPLNFSRFESTASTGLSRSKATSSNPTAISSESSTENQNSGPEPDSDEPPPKATLRERMRFLSRRYGWWALGVYLIASFLDFSITFMAIHFLGAEHIKEWENWIRKKVGLEEQFSDQPSSSILSLEENNQKAAKEAIELRKGSILHSDSKTSNSDNGLSNKSTPPNLNPNGNGNGSTWISTTLWTEIVLAYTIHKTLLLPFRVMLTAAVLPSFVKFMVKIGWSKPNYVVKKAAEKAKERAVLRRGG